MSITFRDRYKTRLTSEPSTNGDFYIGTALNQFHTFGANDDGLQFDIVVVDTNDEWEIREYCTYNHSTKCLSRGNLVDSSTGSVVSLSSSAILAVTLLSKRVPTSSSGTVTNVSATSPINVSNPTTTPALTIDQANATTDGYLSSTDWNTFNNKQAALGFTPYNATNPAGYTSNTGTVTTVSGNGPLTVVNQSTTPSISITQANATTDGYLSSTDWNTFNNKGAPYSLPIASATVLGGVKVDNTTVVAAVDGTLSVTSAGSTSIVRQLIKNNTGSAILKGQPVYINGADGSNVLVALASASAESTSSKTLGLLEQDLPVNGIGYVITDGLLGGIDTDSANAGDPVWLSPTAGQLIFGLVNKPVAPNHLVYIGVVSRKHAVNGEILVKVQNGIELSTEIHDVLCTSLSNNDLLVWESSTSLWKNKQLSSDQVTTALGFTPYDATNPAGYTTNTGTVTTVSGNGPLTVVNGTTTPSISIAQANATTDGYLSSTDWNTFNNKGAPYSLPTASNTVLGGVKVGSGLSIDGSGILSATGGGGSQTLTIVDKTTDYTVVSGDLGKILRFSGTTNRTVTLPDAVAVGSGFNVTIWHNVISGNLYRTVLILPSNSQSIQNDTYFMLMRGEGVQLISDGLNWKLGNDKALSLYSENTNTTTKPAARASNSVAIGTASVTIDGEGSLAIGNSAYASGASSFAVNTLNNTGVWAGAIGFKSAAIGNCRASGSQSISIGLGSALNTNAISIGGNEVSGSFSVGLGENCSTSSTAPYSIATGYQSHTESYGQRVHSSGNIGNDRAQTSTYVLKGHTTNDTELVITTDGLSATTENQITKSQHVAAAFTCLIIAKESGYGQPIKAAWELKGIYDQTSGTVEYNTTTISNVNNWSVRMTNSYIGNLSILVTGETGKSINWVATVNTSEVGTTYISI